MNTLSEQEKVLIYEDLQQTFKRIDNDKKKLEKLKDINSEHLSTILGHQPDAIEEVCFDHFLKEMVESRINSIELNKQKIMKLAGLQ